MDRRRRVGPISRILAENRTGYIDGLTTSRDGDAEKWLRFFIDVVQSAVSYTRSLVMRLKALADEWGVSSSMGGRWYTTGHGSECRPLAGRRQSRIPADPLDRHQASACGSRFEMSCREKHLAERGASGGGICGA
jgi:hypothetical protein